MKLLSLINLSAIGGVILILDYFPTLRPAIPTAIIFGIIAHVASFLILAKLRADILSEATQNREP
jgi:hypothetical protein